MAIKLTERAAEKSHAFTAKSTIRRFCYFALESPVALQQVFNYTLNFDDSFDIESGQPSTEVITAVRRSSLIKGVALYSRRHRSRIANSTAYRKTASTVNNPNRGQELRLLAVSFQARNPPQIGFSRWSFKAGHGCLSKNRWLAGPSQLYFHGYSDHGYEAVLLQPVRGTVNSAPYEPIIEFPNLPRTRTLTT